jgi:uncharacterized membrane-anchored protein YjiN (DUF445 family)
VQTAQGPDRGAGRPSDAASGVETDPPTDPFGRDVPAVGPAVDRTTPGAGSAAPTSSSVGMSMVGLTDDADKRARLRRMKAVSLSFLFGAAVIWLVFRLWEGNGGPAFTGYVRAAAEAGMIGGLADWFAITALFRHPLGIKIPHTALIPRKKDQLGQALSGFVGDNFLAPAVVADKLRTAQVTARVGSWLAAPGNAARVTAELATVVRGAVTVLRDDEIQAVVDQAITRRVVAQPWGPPLGRLLAGVLADGSHRRLVDLICDRAYDWVRTNHETVMALVSKQAPSWSPRFVDGLIADRLYAEALSFAWAVKSDQDHPMRKAVDRFLVSFAADLQDDPEIGERVEVIKRQLLEHPDVQALISRAWATGKAMLLDAAEDPSSQLRLRVTDGVTRFGERLDTDAELRDKIDGWIVDAAGYVVGRYSREITTLISDTVARWDGHEASRKIELQVGRDLQFIRINGTLVGALVGLVIYSVGELIV